MIYHGNRFTLREDASPEQVEEALESLRNLSEITMDTSFVSVKRGNYAVCLHREEGTYPVRTHALQAGNQHPLGIGAGSLAMLSALDDGLHRSRHVGAGRHVGLERGRSPATRRNVRCGLLRRRRTVLCVPGWLRFAQPIAGLFPTGTMPRLPLSAILQRIC